MPFSPLRRRMARNPPWVPLRQSCPRDVLAGVVLGHGVHVHHYQLFLCRPRRGRFWPKKWFRRGHCSPKLVIGKVPCGTDTELWERSDQMRMKDSHRTGPQPLHAPPERREGAWRSRASLGLRVHPASAISPIPSPACTEKLHKHKFSNLKLILSDA